MPSGNLRKLIMANIKLSVVVPCYNEESRVVDGLNHYWSYLKKQKYQSELIFVDDGSTDKTRGEVLKEVQGKKGISVINYNKNQGKGYAIIQGIKSAKGQYILFCDIDHSVPVDTIEKFYDNFEKGADVVIGSRRVKGAKILIHQSWLRETLGRGFTFLVRILIDWKIKDATCGFKAFKNKAAKKIFNSVSIYDWAFDAEVLYLAKKYHLKIAQVPVSWSDVRGSKVSLRKDIARSLFGLIKIRWNDLKRRYN